MKPCKQRNALQKKILAKLNDIQGQNDLEVAN